MSASLLNLFGSIVSQQIINQAGWTLVHSLWQFALLGIFAWLVIKLLHRQSSSARYKALSAIMVVVAISPVITWCTIATWMPTPGQIHKSNIYDPNALNSMSSLENSNESQAIVLESERSDHLKRPSNKNDLAIGKGQYSKADDDGNTVALMSQWMFVFAKQIHPWLPLTVLIWWIGVVACSLRPILSWWTIHRLKKNGTSNVDSDTIKLVDSLKRRLQVDRRVDVLLSNLIHSPVVIGVMQSVILLPVTLIGSLPLAQLEAILAHELAHVKRYDYLVNLMQTLVETFCFYHPAVWWISQRIRIERENCCDDLVVSVLQNRVDYGKALLAIEENLAFTSTLALSARDGSLLHRVQRIAGLPSNSDRPFAHGLSAFLMATIVLAGIACAIANGLYAGAGDGMDSFGKESHGLQLRIIALSPDIDDEKPDLQNKSSAFKTSKKMTFAVELKNVSREPIRLAGIRYGDGYAAETKGKLNTAMLGPFWFDFEFMDRDGKSIHRAQREFYNGWHLADNSSTHLLAPGESLIEVLRPGDFIMLMDYDLQPGKYQVRVRYRGPDDSFRENVRKHWPDKAILNAWSHEVFSNELSFSIKEFSNRTKSEDLIWGKPVDGLQAAIEYRLNDDIKGNPRTAPGVPVGTPLGITFYLRNVSDKVITFVSETGRQGDYVHVTDDAGKDVEVKNMFYSGWPIDVEWKLKPGEVAQLSLLTPNLGSLDQPGKYKVRYTIRFKSRLQKDDLGQVVFPRPGDYDKEVETGETPLYLSEIKKGISANGEIHGRLVDAAGEPIRDATIACGAVINDSRKGGGANTKTDSRGNYRLQVPSPGIYSVWVKEYSRSNGTAAADDGILVEAGKVSTSELRWTNGRRIEGKVIDQQGEPVKQIAVSVYSPARPISGGVQSVRTKDDGTFALVVPPGRVYVYTQQQTARSQDNPLGLGPRAEAVFDLSSSGQETPITLKLGTSPSKFGSDDWLSRSTPGTTIISQQNKADIQGRVVDEVGTPLAGVRMFKEDGAIVLTDEIGAFQYPADKGTQLVMHAFFPGYHVWTGTPTAGDDLQIVLEKKGKASKVKSAKDTRLPWRAYGRVLDLDGKPLEGVTVRAATGIGTLRGGGSGVTDTEGRYDFQFGVGIAFGKDKDGRMNPQTQFAFISAQLDGFYEKNFNRQGEGIASLEVVDEEGLKRWNMQVDQVCLPDKPRKLDFIMLPAAKVAGTLVDEKDQPLADYSVALAGKELPPGSEVLAQVVTDSKGRFVIKDIPTSIGYQFEVRKPRAQLMPPWEDSWASGVISFLEPGENDFATSIKSEAINIPKFIAKSFRLKIVGPGIGGKLAVANAAERMPLADLKQERISAEWSTVDNLTIVLSNKE